MSDQSLATAEITNQSTFRRQYRRRHGMDGQPSDPILGQYTYSTADDEYRCLRCPYRNRRVEYMRSHMISHSHCRPYQCPDCSAAYKRPKELDNHHRSRHQLLKPYVCPHEGCHKRYTQLQTLKDHIDGQHSPLRYRCLLTDCRHRRSRRQPFTSIKQLRLHQRRAHYDPHVANTDGQHPVLSFNEWINSLADNYDTVVAANNDETEGLSTDSSMEALEVSDNMVANTDNTGRHAPPSSPPILPIRKAREVVATDTRSACDGVNTDHNELSGQLSTELFNNTSLATDPKFLTAISISDQSLAITQTTNHNIPRREYRRRQRTDPILGQYSYSTADDEYRCLRCPYRSRRVEYIRQHMVRHSYCRPYRCRDCPAAYKRPEELKRHHRSRHQLLRPYVCPHDGCDKRYTQSQSLKDHIRAKHSPLSYGCLLMNCRHRRSRREPFACLKQLRKHQRRSHYDPLVANTGGQQPVLPFNDWINSLVDNYDTFVADDDETEDLSIEFSTEELEVSDNMVANADITQRHAPPIFPIRKAREVVTTDTRRACYGVDTDHNELSEELSIKPVNNTSLATDPKFLSELSMSDQSLAITQTTNQNIPRHQYRRRHGIVAQPTDPILGQYSYSAADGEYRCLLCPYRSRNRWPHNIRQHMVSHSNRRPYKCPLCPATYKRKHVLLLHHSSRHQLLRPYVCPHDGCDKRYTHSVSLKDHIRAKHSQLRYRCLLTDCRHRRSRRQPFTCLKQLRLHQRRCHYDPLVANTGGEHSVLPFNEWIESVADNYDTVVVDADETESLSNESSAEALEVSDDIADAVGNEVSAPLPPPPSPPILPICEQSVPTDGRRACNGVDTDYSHISGQLSMRRRGHQLIGDHYSLGPSLTPQLVYECNFGSCVYTTGAFEEIADHFMAHWDHYNQGLGHESTDYRD